MQTRYKKKKKKIGDGRQMDGRLLARTMTKGINQEIRIPETLKNWKLNFNKGPKAKCLVGVGLKNRSFPWELAFLSQVSALH